MFIHVTLKMTMAMTLYGLECKCVLVYTWCTLTRVMSKQYHWRCIWSAVAPPTLQQTHVPFTITQYLINPITDGRRTQSAFSACRQRVHCFPLYLASAWPLVASVPHGVASVHCESRRVEDRSVRTRKVHDAVGFANCRWAAAVGVTQCDMH